jgi:antitoxin component YwqK of YwqJK toxin-antitoxin module
MKYLALILMLFSLTYSNTVEKRSGDCLEIEGNTATWYVKQDADRNYVRHGEYVSVYPNGQIALKANFGNGVKHGLTTTWYENGQKEGETHFENGEPHGLSTVWYENGQKKWETHYENGEPHGLSTEWHENGQKKMEAHFENGERISVKRWDENGNLQ